MHLSMHGYGLAMAMALELSAIVSGSLVVVAGRYDLASLDHDGSEGENHRRLRGLLTITIHLQRDAYLRGCLDTLRKIVLRLVHDMMLCEGFN